MLTKTVQKILKKLNLNEDNFVLSEEIKRKIKELFLSKGNREFLNIISKEDLHEVGLTCEYDFIKTSGDLEKIYMVVAEANSGENLESKITIDIDTGEWVLCKTNKEESAFRYEDADARAKCLKKLDSINGCSENRYRGIAVIGGNKVYLFEEIMPGEPLVDCLQNTEKVIGFEERFDILLLLIEVHRNLVENEIHHDDFANFFHNVFYDRGESYDSYDRGESYDNDDSDESYDSKKVKLEKKLNFIDFGGSCTKKETKCFLLNSIENIFSNYGHDNFSSDEFLREKVFFEYNDIIFRFFCDIRGVKNKCKDTKENDEVVFNYETLIKEIKKLKEKYIKIERSIEKIHQKSEAIINEKFLFNQGNFFHTISDYVSSIESFISAVNCPEDSIYDDSGFFRVKYASEALKKIFNFLNASKLPGVKILLKDILERENFICNLLFCRFDILLDIVKQEEFRLIIFKRLIKINQEFSFERIKNLFLDVGLHEGGEYCLAKDLYKVAKNEMQNEEQNEIFENNDSGANKYFSHSDRMASRLFSELSLEFCDREEKFSFLIRLLAIKFNCDLRKNMNIAIAFKKNTIKCEHNKNTMECGNNKAYIVEMSGEKMGSFLSEISGNFIKMKEVIERVKAFSKNGIMKFISLIEQIMDHHFYDVAVSLLERLIERLIKEEYRFEIGSHLKKISTKLGSSEEKNFVIKNERSLSAFLENSSLFGLEYSKRLGIAVGKYEQFMSNEKNIVSDEKVKIGNGKGSKKYFERLHF